MNATETWDENWARKAQCKEVGLDTMFVRGAEQNRAKNVCAGCPVKMECLAEALDSKLEWGVWGGMTERERRAVLKKRPNVTSWRRLFEAARAEQLASHDDAQAAARRMAARRAVVETTSAVAVAVRRPA
ncbi:WhiB family transcriptional regulator [Nocardioides caldifontis]|uniref:WhiB family transcriptional regulator n=1 Tax=Nocardioides caldifontis TaxID=2588938 RepID=UPI0011DFB4A5|nr:WhiB family transcriptional regulator [Nocardioides caldifontis]